MLAAAQRLRRSSEFAAAIRRGRRATRGSLVVHLRLPERPAARPLDDDSGGPRLPGGQQATQGPAARAGFVVSKAVGGAVVRNKVRRRLRHLVRDRLDQLPAGTTLVVRALPEAAQASFARLGADLDAALTAAQTSRKSGRRS